MPSKVRDGITYPSQISTAAPLKFATLENSVKFVNEWVIKSHIF